LKYLEPNEGLIGTYLNLIVLSELVKLRKNKNKNLEPLGL
jgi:hypothetical protein